MNNRNIAIIAGSFHADEIAIMLAAAENTIEEKGAKLHSVVRVPGAYEQSVSDALVRLQLDSMKPIGIGIIGPEADPCHFPPRLEPHARAAAEAATLML